MIRTPDHRWRARPRTARFPGPGSVSGRAGCGSGRGPAPARRDGTAGLRDLHLAGRDQPPGRTAGRFHELAPAVVVPFVHRPCGVGGADGGRRTAPLEQLQDHPFHTTVVVPFAVRHTAIVRRRRAAGQRRSGRAADGRAAVLRGPGRPLSGRPLRRRPHARTRPLRRGRRGRRCRQRGRGWPRRPHTPGRRAGRGAVRHGPRGSRGREDRRGTRRIRWWRRDRPGPSRRGPTPLPRRARGGNPSEAPSPQSSTATPASGALDELPGRRSRPGRLRQDGPPVRRVPGGPVRRRQGDVSDRPGLSGSAPRPPARPVGRRAG